MRALALLLVLLGPLAASAQNRLTSAERMLMAVPATVVAVNVFFQGGEDAPLLARGAVTTVASGLAVYGVGRVLGNSGRFVPTMAGAAAGAVPAIALGSIAGLLPEYSDDAASMRVGAFLAYTFLTPVTALIGFDWSQAAAQPVVLVGPSGERTPGLALTVAL